MQDFFTTVVAVLIALSTFNLPAAKVLISPPTQQSTTYPSVSHASITDQTTKETSKTETQVAPPSISPVITAQSFVDTTYDGQKNQQWVSTSTDGNLVAITNGIRDYVAVTFITDKNNNRLTPYYQGYMHSWSQDGKKILIHAQYVNVLNGPAEYYVDIPTDSNLSLNTSTAEIPTINVSKSDAIEAAKKEGLIKHFIPSLITRRMILQSASSTGSGMAWFVNDAIDNSSFSGCPKGGGNISYEIYGYFEMNATTGQISVLPKCFKRVVLQGGDQ